MNRFMMFHESTQGTTEVFYLAYESGDVLSTSLLDLIGKGLALVGDVSRTADKLARLLNRAQKVNDIAGSVADMQTDEGRADEVEQVVPSGFEAGVPFPEWSSFQANGFQTYWTSGQAYKLAWVEFTPILKTAVVSTATAASLVLMRGVRARYVPVTAPVPVPTYNPGQYIERVRPRGSLWLPLSSTYGRGSYSIGNWRDSGYKLVTSIVIGAPWLSAWSAPLQPIGGAWWWVHYLAGYMPFVPQLEEHSIFGVLVSLCSSDWSSDWQFTPLRKNPFDTSDRISYHTGWYRLLLPTIFPFSYTSGSFYRYYYYAYDSSSLPGFFIPGGGSGGSSGLPPLLPPGILLPIVLGGGLGGALWGGQEIMINTDWLFINGRRVKT